MAAERCKRFITEKAQAGTAVGRAIAARLLVLLPSAAEHMAQMMGEPLSNDRRIWGVAAAFR